MSGRRTCAPGVTVTGEGSRLSSVFGFDGYLPWVEVRVRCLPYVVRRVSPYVRTPPPYPLGFVPFPKSRPGFPVRPGSPTPLMCHDGPDLFRVGPGPYPTQRTHDPTATRVTGGRTGRRVGGPEHPEVSTGGGPLEDPGTRHPLHLHAPRGRCTHRCPRRGFRSLSVRTHFQFPELGVVGTQPLRPGSIGNRGWTGRPRGNSGSEVDEDPTPTVGVGCFTVTLGPGLHRPEPAPCPEVD